MLPLAFLLTFHLIPQTATDFKQPQLAANERVVVATFGSADTVYFSSSRDRGKTFSEPVKVANAPKLMLGNHRGPRIALTRSAIVISAIANEELLSWRSLDGGKSWLPGARINDTPQAPREGLHAMASGRDGTLYTAWLDLRNLTPGKPGTQLFGSVSHDQGATWSKNTLIYSSPSGSICQCCHPSLAVQDSGEVFVMWRNEVNGSRDMYVAFSIDGGKTFANAEKLGAGTWPLKACPMDGGGLALDAHGKVMTAWRREGSVYLAPLAGAEAALGEGRNPAIAVGSEGLFVAWTGPDGVHARVPGKPEPVLLDHEGGFVQLAAVPNGPVVAAWERKGSIQFQVLP